MQEDDSLQSRMIRAARLDAALYDEVRDDPRAFPQALLVVVLSAVATGIGLGQGDLHVIVLGTVFAVLGWYLTAYLAYWIGARILPERETRAHPIELLRSTGFASAPGILRMLGALPELELAVFVGTTVWMVCAVVIAIRQALRYRSTGRAIGVYAIVQLVQILLLLLLFGGAPLSPPGPAS